MAKVISVIKRLLDDDIRYVKMGKGTYDGMDVEVSHYGEATLQVIMGLNFQCNNCGGCCASSKDNICGERTEKDCRSYGKNRPLLCKIYPFVMPSELTLFEGKPAILDRLEMEKFAVDGEEAYRFGLYKGLDLVIESTCQGWMRGETMVKEMGRKVVDDIISSDGARIFPPYARPANYQKKIVADAICGFKEASVRPEINLGEIFCDVWDKKVEKPKEKFSVLKTLPAQLNHPECFKINVKMPKVKYKKRKK